MSLLRDHRWRTKYDSDAVSLVREFYEPVLGCAVRYDRSTGFFSARVLTLAARGVEELVRNGGRVRLIVGCTLGDAEVEAIRRGESLRDTVEARLMKTPLAPADAVESEALELLSWMVAQGILEVKVAVPCTSARTPCADNAIFHEKAGIIEDKTGDRLAFNGSVNETPHGWSANWESFHVFTDFAGGRDHVDAEEATFAAIWNDRARRCRVVDVPTAVREDLLRFLPQSDAPPRRLHQANVEAVPPEPPPVEVETPVPAVDCRRLVWGIIRHAPSFRGAGDRVGEATSAVTPWPHQVRAFERLYSHWPPRLLIADEVGLGKTIQAGMLLRQALLAGRARRILVLAPKAVLRQWQVELREKFNLNWPIYDGQQLCWYDCPALGRAAVRRVSESEWHREPCLLVASQLVRRGNRASQLLKADPWDLVVLDEAHHARRRGVGGPDERPNKLLDLMHRLRARTQGVVLMTATPMQVHPVEVWDLLALLGLPPEWTASTFIEFFDSVASGNPSHDDFERVAALFRASERFFGGTTEEAALRFFSNGSRLGARKVLRALRDEAHTERRQLDADRRRAALSLMRANTPVARLVSRHTRELLRRYQASGRLASRIATRDVRDEFVTLSGAERTVYEQVADYISTTYDRSAAAERNAVGFVMTVYRRRLASSFAALARTLEKRLADVGRQGTTAGATEEDLSDDETLTDVMDLDEAAALSREALRREETAEIERLLRDVRSLPIDSKARALLRVIEELRSAGYRQVMVFTQFTDTMDFLRDMVTRETGLEVLCFSGRGGERAERSGRWLTVSRDEVKRLFREGTGDVLLCTDAAAEGLNFQFCGALVNYDMPWNPMRVEQRIGRIDRLGQAFERIRVLNLYYQDSVETDVYVALRERYGLFTQFVGRLQPILSTLPRDIADFVLAGRRDEVRRRAELVNEIETRVQEARAAGFDLDEATQADVDEPPRPRAFYDLDSLDAVIRRPGLLPPGIEVGPLGRREYQVSMPGMSEPLRVTTDPEYFDEHPGSTELWSPGSPLFPTYDAPATRDEVAAAGADLRVAIERVR